MNRSATRACRPLSLSSISLGPDRSTQDNEHRAGNADSRYIFYRFYSPSAAIVSRNAFDPIDPFLGRIKLTAVTPPRTIDSLKRCLAWAENLNDPSNQRTDLYLTASSDSPIQNGNLSIVGVDLGSSARSALALVLRQDLADSEKASVGGIRVPDNFRISPGILEGRRRSQMTTEPHYVYYRVYAPEKAIPSSAAFHQRDSFTGRLDVTRIPPPHTVATLTRCLADSEKLTHQHVHPTIFLTAASQSPMLGIQKISVQGSGPGSVPEEPFALVLSVNPGLRGSEHPSAQEGPGSSSTNSSHYLYYRLYSCGGETPSKTAFDPHDPALGRVDRNHVTPPHTASSIRRCIAKVEENPRYICGELYPDNANSTAIPDGLYVSLAAAQGRGLGMSPSTAVVLVEQERREGVFNRPTKCVVSGDRGSRLSGWLKCTRGEVVFTDAVLQDASQTGSGSSIVPMPAYIAVAASGRRGFISPGSFKFLDELLPDARRVLQS
ncbi:hypothetical protein B0H11DRAFT_2238394 [Mycena galericulata]|nr:hypothetical protein B0H11DRAFT_2238394 [Mycena galericulata]